MPNQSANHLIVQEFPKIKNQLLQNREIAKLLNLNGTPAFIIGNIIYPGAINKNNLKTMIKNFRES